MKNLIQELAYVAGTMLIVSASIIFVFTILAVLVKFFVAPLMIWAAMA